MIVFELVCNQSHRFEGWFVSPEGFDQQRDRGLLSCPACGTNEVAKLLTAKIAKHPAESEHGHPTGAAAKPAAPAAINLAELIDYFLANTEDVGAEFANEARRIHSQQAPNRGIRGETSPEEAAELIEEGIPVLALPVPPKSKWN
jgi:hypothetical protein